MKSNDLISPTSVFLVSGGAKGITAHCVIKIAEKYHCKFILFGRSSIDTTIPSWAVNDMDDVSVKKHILEDEKKQGTKPTPLQIQNIARSIKSQFEILNTLQAIKQAGGEAQYISVDVTDFASLREKISQVHGFEPVTGIIHGAGNLADKFIEKKSEIDYETVFSPKVDGLQNLLKCIPPSQLQYLIFFSSIVGFYGNKGQSDYAIANEILNKTAHLIKHRHPSCRIVSIGWGPWENGMVSPELKKYFEKNNVRVIPGEVGANILLQELDAYEKKDAQVVVGDPLPHQAEIHNGELREYTIHRRLSLAANPFLYDHMIGNHPVLPATCAATWAVSTCEQLYPTCSFFKLNDFRVLKGIVFDETLADDYILDLKETNKTSDGSIIFDAVIWSKNKQGKSYFHYKLNIELRQKLPAMPRLDPIKENISSPAEPIPGKLLYQNGTLFHGRSFQGIYQVNSITPQRLTGLCKLPRIEACRQGQFAFRSSNPFIYDAMAQYLLVWAQYYHSAPCLPSYLKCLEQYQSIPFEMVSYINVEVEAKGDSMVRGNVTVQDKLGNVYVKISGMEGTISKNLNRLITQNHVVPITDTHPVVAEHQTDARNSQ